MKLLRRTRLLAAGALTAAVAIVATAPIASAGTQSMSISPTQGPLGTVITVTATGGCFTSNDLTIQLYMGYDGTNAPGGSSPIVTDHHSGTADGSWTYTITVPVIPIPNQPTVPFTVTAFCSIPPPAERAGLRSQVSGFYYTPQEFLVIQQAPTTTTVAPTTTVAATTTTVATAPQAITATPTYTG